MLCRYPYMIGSLPVPCGGTHKTQFNVRLPCLPCRVNKRRLWAHRMLLESYKHGDNSFVTLTYSGPHLCSDGSLYPEHYQKFLRKLRKSIAPEKVRFFCAGEYGSKTQRPHFHLALFGLPGCRRGQTDLTLDTCCSRCDVVQRAWPYGKAHVAEFNYSVANYIAGYVTKKMTLKEDFPDGRYPEFARMSLRPGIGRSAIPELATMVLDSKAGTDFVVASGDVPHSLRHGMRNLPLGRYLRREFRGELGFASKDAPSETSKMYVLQLLAEQKAARSLNPKLSKSYGRKIVLDMNSQKSSNLEARFKVHSSGGTI